MWILGVIKMLVPPIRPPFLTILLKFIHCLVSLINLRIYYTGFSRVGQLYIFRAAFSTTKFRLDTVAYTLYTSGGQALSRICTSFCTGAAGSARLLRCNIVPEFSTTILPVVKKQRQNLQCGKKTTANFAVRVNPIRESPYVVFLHHA